MNDPLTEQLNQSPRWIPFSEREPTEAEWKTGVYISTIGSAHVWDGLRHSIEIQDKQCWIRNPFPPIPPREPTQERHGSAPANGWAAGEYLRADGDWGKCRVGPLMVCRDYISIEVAGVIHWVPPGGVRLPNAKLCSEAEKGRLGC